MVDINLLPWREEARQQRKQTFIYTQILAGIAAIIVIAIVHFCIKHRVSQQNHRNGYLINLMHNVDQKIASGNDYIKKNSGLLQNMRLIQDLHNNKYGSVGILAELVKIVPESVTLIKVTRKEGKIIINGTSPSNEDITVFLKRLTASQWVDKPELNEIKVGPTGGTEKYFELVADEKKSREEILEKELADKKAKEKKINQPPGKADASVTKH